MISLIAVLAALCLSTINATAQNVNSGLRTNSKKISEATTTFNCDCLKVPTQFAKRSSQFAPSEKYTTLDDATQAAEGIFNELRSGIGPGAKEKGINILACASTRTLTVDDKTLLPCAPIDRDLTSIDSTFFRATGKGALFMMPTDGEKKGADSTFDVATFTADFFSHEFCYALDELPGFAANYAVLIGM
tara:strand:+ start:269 stop:838 length:570 start_codon:yes stop_codon:yes gene_type:complete